MTREPISGKTAPWVERLRSLVATQLGVRVSAAQLPGLEAFARERARRLGLEIDGYLDRLILVPQEQRRLWSRATIGETYFLREEHHLTAALADASGRHAGRRPLQIWCVGCSTGEEVYTLALLAREQGWSVEILGTDVNDDALARARSGEYTPWSLRRLSPERLGRFTLLGDGELRTVGPDLRQGVSFEALNLMSHGYPSPKSAAGWDLIFCRNVLIYFEAEQVERIAVRLLESLAPEGRLVLGAAEPLRSIPGAHGERESGTLVYRRSAPEESPAAAPLPSKDRRADGAPELSKATAIAEALKCLSADRPEAALTTLDRLSPTEAPCPEAEYLRAIIARRSGQFSAMERHLRFSLSIEPNFWPSAFLLATGYHRTGHESEAMTYFRQVLDRLDPPHDEPGREPEEWHSLDAVLPFRGDVIQICRRRLAG